MVDMDVVDVASDMPREDLVAVEQLSSELGMRASAGQEPLSDSMTLLRFYLHRDRVVDAAAEMYRETIQWRESFNLQQVMSDYGTGEDYSESGSRLSAGPWRWTWQPSSLEAQQVAPYVFFGRLSHAAADGSPVLVWRAGQADYSGFVREELVSEMIRAFVAHFEDALQSCRSATRRWKKFVRARVVIDAMGFDLENLRYLQVLRHIMRLVQDHFPEVSASVTVVRAHWSVVALYDILKPWLTEHVQNKVCFLSDDFHDGLKQHSGLDVAMLPKFLGGLVPDEEAGEALKVPFGQKG